MVRKKTIRLVLAQILVGIVALGNAGCAVLAIGAAAGAGAAGYAYATRTVVQTHNGNSNITWSATHLALADLNLPVAKSDPKKLTLESLSPEKDRIYISLEPKNVPATGGRTFYATDVAVRVGVFGDHELSDINHAQIAARLQQPINGKYVGPFGDKQIAPPNQYPVSPTNFTPPETPPPPSTKSPVSGTQPTAIQSPPPVSDNEPPLAKPRDS